MAKPDDSMMDSKQRRRSGPAAFFRESYQEIRRVRWPRRHEVVSYTAAALVTCVVLGLFVWGFDLGVNKLMSLIGLV